MFLNRLNTDEKESFLSLAVRAAEANETIADEEYQMINDYCVEMNISSFDIQKAKSMEEVEAVFSCSDREIVNIVLLEAIGLMYADGDYDLEEKCFIYDLASHLSVSSKKIESIEAILEKYLQITEEIVSCIEQP